MLVSIKIIKLFVNLICELIIPVLCKDCVLKSTNMRRALYMRFKNLQIIIGHQDLPQITAKSTFLILKKNF